MAKVNHLVTFKKSFSCFKPLSKSPNGSYQTYILMDTYIEKLKIIILSRYDHKGKLNIV